MSKNRPGRWTRRIAIVVIAVLVLVGGGFAAIRLYLSDARIARLLEEELGAAFGRETSVKSVNLRLFAAALNVEGVVVSEKREYGNAPLITVDSMEVQFRLLPLLRGSVELESVKISSAKINIIQDKTGTLNVTDMPLLEMSSAPAAAEPEAILPELRVEDIGVSSGQLVFTDSLTDSGFRLEDVSLKGKAECLDGRTLKLFASVHGPSIAASALDSPSWELRGWKTSWDLEVDLEDGDVTFPALGFETQGISCKGRLAALDLGADDPKLDAQMNFTIDLDELPLSSFLGDGYSGRGTVNSKLGIAGQFSGLIISIASSMDELSVTMPGGADQTFTIESGTVKQSIGLKEDGLIDLDGSISMTNLGAISKPERLSSLSLQNKLLLKGESIAIDHLSLKAPGAAISVRGEANAGTEAEPGILNITGDANISLSQFVEPLTADFTGLRGDLDAQFSLRGSTEAPELHLKCQSKLLSMIELASKTRFVLEQLSIEQNTTGNDPASLPVEGSLSCRRLEIDAPDEPPRRFTDISINNRLVLNSRDDHLGIESVSVRLPGVALKSSGAIRKMSSDDPKIDAKGSGDIDLAKLLPLVRPFAGFTKDELDGNGRMRFSFQASSEETASDVRFKAGADAIVLSYSPKDSPASGTRYALRGLDIKQHAVASDQHVTTIKGAISCRTVSLTAAGQEPRSFNDIELDNHLILDLEKDALGVPELVVSIPGVEFKSEGEVQKLSSGSPSLQAKGKGDIMLADLVLLTRPFIGIAKDEFDAAGKLSFEGNGQFGAAAAMGELKAASERVALTFKAPERGATRSNLTLKGLEFHQKAAETASGSIAIEGGLSCNRLSLASGSNGADEFPSVGVRNRIVLETQEDKLQIDDLSITAPGVTLTSSGVVSGLASNDPKIDAKGKGEVDLAQLFTVLRPILGMSKQELDADGRLDIDLTGRVGSNPTDIRVAVASPRVSLRYRPKEEDKKSASKQQASKDPEPVDFGDLRAHLTSRFDAFVFNDIPGESQVIDLLLEDNRLAINRADMRLSGGSVTNRGWVKIDEPGWKYSIQTEALDAKLSSLYEFFPLLRWAQITGKIGGDSALSGKGTTMESLQKHLTGKLRFNARDGKLTPGPIVSSVGAVLGLEVLTKPIPFRELKGQATIKDGRINIAKTDMTASDLTMEMQGGIWLDGKLDMGLVVTLSEQLSSRMSGLGQIASLRGKKLRIPFAIKGTLASPKPIPDLGYLLEEAAKDQAMDLLEGFLKKK